MPLGGCVCRAVYVCQCAFVCVCVCVCVCVRGHVCTRACAYQCARVVCVSFCVCVCVCVRAPAFSTAMLELLLMSTLCVSVLLNC